MDSEHGKQLIMDSPDASLFACTKDFLLSLPQDVCENNVQTMKIRRQMDAIIDHVVEPVSVEGFITWKDYHQFRQGMFAIRNSYYDAEEKNDYLSFSWSLMNLFQTAVFSMDTV